MTESSGEKPTVRSSVEAEHAQVRVMADQIAAAGDVTTLLGVLREYRGTLKHHFAAEEAPQGLYDAILAEGPHHENQLGKLRTQHEELLAGIDALCADCERADASGAGPDAILERGRELGRSLDEHETAENHLLLEVFEQDLGVGD